ncbi:MAG: hypothetical protein HY544_03975 [Candidatus Diapherotrites archaeon]|uniref:DNA primase large subunit PriL n=1 Tax=Candidatus Iainarchaeum sp. TaxID=3101447 RepID=A0A8T3YMY3_9ARCH|nr:hypothetical protein [Candidatus Diapherotrites archaeon]
MGSFTIQELRQAQKYPFLPVARAVVAESGFSLLEVPEPVMRRARAMVAAAFSEKPYRPPGGEHSEVLSEEVLAFPVAKILVSLINRLELYRRFCGMVGKSAVSHLRDDSEKSHKFLFGIADEMKIKSVPSETPDFFAEVALADFLRADAGSVSGKLVNQRVRKGRVILTSDEFIRFISAVAENELRQSFPLDVKGVPKSFVAEAASLEGEFSQAVRKSFSREDFGEIRPEAFPPCMAKIYGELAAGVNVSHTARFAMATFLNSVGMGAEQIIAAYKNTPNFSESTTRYQVGSICGKKTSAGEGYSSPSCDKMRSYALCVANCPVSHPVQFYSREVLKVNAWPQRATSEEKYG